MSHEVFRVHKPAEYRKAGSMDLVALLAAPGETPLYLPKSDLESLVYGLASAQRVHLSGPTGTAKTSVIRALSAVPTNFESIAEALGFEPKPLRVWPIDMVRFDAPSELLMRRSLENGKTFDEPSCLITAIEAAAAEEGVYRAVWLREIGRVHAAAIQGGLLDLVVTGSVRAASGTEIPTSDIAFVADSNYAAAADFTHTLVTFDDALRRRFDVNISLTYLSKEQEVTALREMVRALGLLVEIDEAWAESLQNIVALGHAIRGKREEGSLLSVVPPNLGGYLSFVRMRAKLRHFTDREIAAATMLGNADAEDQKDISTLFSEVFQAGRVESDDLGGEMY